MNIVRLAEREDGSWVWFCGNDIIARVHATGGKWQVTRYPDPGDWPLPGDFECAEDACLAVERWGLTHAQRFGRWFESRRGGYFRERDKKRVHVRQARRGWYVVRADGKVLARSETTSWFATAVEACKAVDEEELDLFASMDGKWSWIKLTEKERAEQT